MRDDEQPPLFSASVDHALHERERLLREAPLSVDTRDALHGIEGDRSKVHGL